MGAATPQCVRQYTGVHRCVCPEHVRYVPHASSKSTCILVQTTHLSSFFCLHLQRFLPRDATHKRGYCRRAVSVCPSVCLSVTFVSCVKTNKDIFEIFSPSGSKAILVIFMSNGMVLIQRKPPNGGVECKGVWKNDDFRPISRSIWETVIVRWAHSARQFVSIEFSFYPYNI